MLNGIHFICSTVKKNLRCFDVFKIRTKQIVSLVEKTQEEI